MGDKEYGSVSATNIGDVCDKKNTGGLTGAC